MSLDNNFDKENPDGLFSYKYRTNPQADALNAMRVLGLERIGFEAKYNPAFDIAITLAGDTTTITPGGDTAGFRYYTFIVSDKFGTEVVGQMDIVTPAAIVIDSSGLDASVEWVIQYSAQKAVGEGQENSFLAKIAVDYPASNPSISIDYAQEAAEMDIKIDGGSIADGGSYNAGLTIAQDSVVFVDFVIDNLGVAPLSISAISVSGDGSHQPLIIPQVFPYALSSGNSDVLNRVLLDTSALGAKTASVAIDNSDADENPYNFDITFTVV